MNVRSIKNDFTKNKSKTEIIFNTDYLNCKFGMFKLVILFIYLTNLFSTSYGSPFTSVEFVIKNKYTGKYIHPLPALPYIDSSYLTTAAGYHSGTYFVFQPVDNIWGYIRSPSRHENWKPASGTRKTKANGEKLVLSNYNQRECLFAIDQINNQIIHRDGMFVHPLSGYNPYPPNGDLLILYETAHEWSEWILINPKNSTENVYPYGSAKISGQWKLVFAVENPLALQTWQYKYKLGKSHTEKTSSSFKFAWEMEASANFFFAKMSTKVTLTTQIETSSEETWSGETEETNSIEVEPGKTVVVWQKEFIGKQFGHKAIFQSNHFAHTNHTDVQPED